jgi:hypothetical protein
MRVSCEFETFDKDEVPIRCRHDTWANHIVDEHRAMQDQAALVQQAIRDPAYVYQDQRYPRRKIFYRLAVLPFSYVCYIRVVVEYRRPHNKRHGEVITAFAAANIRSGDVLIWSKYEKLNP